MITNEEDKQKEFINATLQQLKENISNFITSTNYSNIQSLYLRQQIDDYQKEYNRLNQQKIYQRQLSENSTLKNEIVLPLLLNSKNPKISYKKESIYSPQTSYRKKESKKKQEKNINDIFNPSLSIKESLSSEIKHLKNKEYLKYCNEYRNQRYYHPKYLDKNGNFIVKKEDMEQGIYDVITKGLVPKSVDMTPALGIGGSPLSITKKKYDGKNSNRIYNRSEVATGNLDKFTYNKYEVNELYNNRNNSKIKLEPITKDWGIKSKRKEPFYHETLPENRKNVGTNVNKTLDIENAKANNNVFITAGNTNMSEIQEMTENNMLNNISEIKAKNNSSIKFNNSSSTNAYSRSRQLNSNASKQMNSYSKTIKIEDETIKSFPDYILDIDMTNNIIISFELYKLTKNENYYKFINENKDKIFQIENILNNMCNLFKKLNIINVSIDSNKILSLLKYYKNKKYYK